MSQKITKRIVDTLIADGTVWDATIKGFGVRRSGDVISYFVKYRVGSGRLARQRMLTIGRHGSPWTPDAARDRAVELLHEARLGRDPADAVKPSEKSMTVAKLCDLYLDGIEARILPGKGRAKKSRTIEADRSNITRHIKPLLGGQRIDQLTDQDIERFQRDVAAGKSAIVEKTKPRGVARVRGGKGIASRVTAVLAAILAWGVKKKYLAASPAKGVTLYKTKEIKRYLKQEEGERLGEAFAAAESEWKHWSEEAAHARQNSLPQPPRRGENPIAIAALRVLLLTGARKLEILGLRWDWIDFEQRLFLLPDSKTGAKTIYVDERVIEIVRSLPRLEKEPFVFPGAKEGTHFTGLYKVWDRIRKKAALADVRLHDLRHNFASSATNAGVGLQAVAHMLGHADLRTTKKYAHIADEPLRRVTQENAARIAAQVMRSRSSVE